MNKKIKISVLGIFIILTGIFLGATNVALAGVVPTCNSATFNGSVTTNGISTSVWFEWGTTQSLGQSTAHQTFNSDSNFSQLITGLTPSTTYYYRAMAQNNAGTAIGDTIPFTTATCQVANHAPVITLNGSNTVSINVGQSYNDAGANASDQEDGNITANIVKTGSVDTSIAGVYTITYNVSDSQGLSATPVSRTVTVSTPAQQPTMGNSYTTTTCNSVTFNGHVMPNGNSTQVWFEWGTTQSLGQSTAHQTFNSDSNFSQLISNLSPNTTYYYRAMASNSVGTATGQIISFTTSTCQVYNPTVNLTVDTSNVTYGGSTTVRWNSSNATSCYGTNGANGWSNGLKTLSGSFYTGILTSDTTFGITCSNATGSATDFKLITVGSPQAQNPTVTLTVDSANVTYGGSTTVRWNSSNATTCFGSGGSNNWAGTKSLSGNFGTGPLTSTTTFSIACSNSVGSANDSKTITVGNQQINNPTVNLTVDTSNVTYGGSTTVRWNSSNATSCYGTNGANGWSNGLKTLSGSFYTGILTSDTTFGITCSNATGSATDFKLITVGSPQAQNPTVTLTVDSANVTYGGSTTVRWNSSNATTCFGSGGSNNWAGTKSLSGNFGTGPLTSTTTFSIACSNSVGSANDSKTITVGNQQINNPTVNLTVDTSNVTYGGSTTVRWNSSNATSCYGTNGANGWSNGLKTLSGSFYTGILTSDTTFGITCSNATGSATDFKLITVGSPQAQNPTVTLTVDSANVTYGGSTTVRWNSSNATTCFGSGGSNNWAGTKSLSGNFGTGPLTSTTTFSIACSNSVGSANDSKTITVGNQQINNPTVNLTVDTSNVTYGGSTTVRWNSSNATSCYGTNGANGWSNGLKTLSGSFYTGILTSDTTFGITCSNATGSATDFKLITVGSPQAQNPTVTLTVDSANVTYGGSTTVRWNSSNATTCFGSGGSNNWAGTKSLSGNFGTGPLTSTTTFSIACSNSVGSANDSKTITVGNQQINNPTVNLTVDTSNVTYGGSTTVRWNSSNATSCYGTNGANGWSNGLKTLSGSFYTGILTSDTTFGITCSNATGSATDFKLITVGSPSQNPPIVKTNPPTVKTR